MITFDEGKNDAAVGGPCNIQYQVNEDRDKGNAMMVSGKVFLAATMSIISIHHLYTVPMLSVREIENMLHEAVLSPWILWNYMNIVVYAWSSIHSVFVMRQRELLEICR